jgi:hypothetical protein
MLLITINGHVFKGIMIIVAFRFIDVIAVIVVSARLPDGLTYYQYIVSCSCERKKTP